MRECIDKIDTYLSCQSSVAKSLLHDDVYASL